MQNVKIKKCLIVFSLDDDRQVVEFDADPGYLTLFELTTVMPKYNPDLQSWQRVPERKLKLDLSFEFPSSTFRLDDDAADA